MKKSAAAWTGCLVMDLKIVWTELLHFLIRAWTLPGFVWHQLKRRELRKKMLPTLGAVVMAYAAGAAMLLAKGRLWEMSVSLMAMAWIVPSATVCAVMAVVFNVDQKMFCIIQCLCAAGLVTQIGLSPSSAAELILHYTLAFATALVGAVVLHFLAGISPETVIHVCCMVSVLLYLVLLCQPDRHGTRAWLYIGSTSLQGTEIQRVLATVSMARAATLPETTDGKRTNLLFGILCLHLCGLAAVNELATALVMVLSGLGICFLTQKDLRWLVRYGVLLIIAGYGALLCCKLCAQLGGRGPLKLGRLVYNKVVQRLTNGGDGYQTGMAQKALLLSGWWGSDTLVRNVPAADSDLCMITAGQLFGVSMILFVLLCFVGLLLCGLETAARIGPGFPAACVAGCLFQIVLQAVLNILSEIGAGPLMGISCPYIGLSGTGTVVALLFNGMMLAGLSPDLPAAEAVYFERKKR